MRILTVVKRYDIVEAENTPQENRQKKSQAQHLFMQVLIIIVQLGVFTVSEIHGSTKSHSWNHLNLVYIM